MKKMIFFHRKYMVNFQNSQKHLEESRYHTLQLEVPLFAGDVDTMETLEFVPIGFSIELWDKHRHFKHNMTTGSTHLRGKYLQNMSANGMLIEKRVTIGKIEHRCLYFFSLLLNLVEGWNFPIED